MSRLHLFYLVLAALVPRSGMQAQDSLKTNPWGIQFHGFIKSDVWYDSRQIVGAREDLLLLFPKAPEYDVNNEDINAIHSYNFSAITSRIAGYIQGPEAFGAKSTAFIEADFSGLSNADASGFRLRHAYVKLEWEKSALLFGHYWHPFFVPEVFPSVLGLNTGAPFQPFNRSPQIQYIRQDGNIKMILAAISQLDYMNDGPNGPSPKYLRQAGYPNLHLQMQYQKGSCTFGTAIDHKSLRPKVLTDSMEISRESVSGWSYMAFAKYKKDPWLFKAKVIYGQNLTEHLLLGGYAVRDYDVSKGKQTYTPTQHLFYWGNVIYQVSPGFELGVFAAYSQNLGTLEENTGIYYARGSNMDYAYRISPIFIFKSGKVSLMTELEYSAVAYGIPDKTGRVNNAKETGNLRVQFTAFHFF